MKIRREYVILTLGNLGSTERLFDDHIATYKCNVTDWWKLIVAEKAYPWDQE